MVCRSLPNSGFMPLTYTGAMKRRTRPNFALRINSRFGVPMSDMPMPDLKSGDRLRLNQLGRLRNPRMVDRFCTVVTVSGERMSQNSVVVRFDGNVSATRIHRSYLEPIPSRPAL
jgi:hypothetical protein